MLGGDPLLSQVSREVLTAAVFPYLLTRRHSRVRTAEYPLASLIALVSWTSGLTESLENDGYYDLFTDTLADHLFTEIASETGKAFTVA